MSPMPVHEGHHDGQCGHRENYAYKPHAKLRVGKNPQAGLQQVIVERRVNVVQGETGHAPETELFRKPRKPFINPHALLSQVQESQGCPQEEDGEQTPADLKDSLLWLVFYHLTGRNVPDRPDNVTFVRGNGARTGIVSRRTALGLQIGGCIV